MKIDISVDIDELIENILKDEKLFNFMMDELTNKTKTLTIRLTSTSQCHSAGAPKSAAKTPTSELSSSRPAPALHIYIDKAGKINEMQKHWRYYLAENISPLWHENHASAEAPKSAAKMPTSELTKV